MWNVDKRCKNSKFFECKMLSVKLETQLSILHHRLESPGEYFPGTFLTDKTFNFNSGLFLHEITSIHEDFSFFFRFLRDFYFWACLTQTLLLDPSHLSICPDIL